jgi:hypothetical protein
MHHAAEFRWPTVSPSLFTSCHRQRVKLGAQCSPHAPIAEGPRLRPHLQPHTILLPHRHWFAAALTTPLVRTPSRLSWLGSGVAAWWPIPIVHCPAIDYVILSPSSWRALHKILRPATMTAHQCTLAAHPLYALRLCPGGLGPTRLFDSRNELWPLVVSSWATCVMLLGYFTCKVYIHLNLCNTLGYGWGLLSMFKCSNATPLCCYENYEEDIDYFVV